MTHSRSSDGYSEQYDCDMGCHLRIEIVHGETMHAELPREKWIRPEPRKPREWTVCADEQGRLWDYRHTHRDNCFTVREVIEPSRDQRTWFAEFPLDGGVGQIFTDPRQLTKGGKLVEVMEILE